MLHGLRIFRGGQVIFLHFSGKHISGTNASNFNISYLKKEEAYQDYSDQITAYVHDRSRQLQNVCILHHVYTTIARTCTKY